MITIKTHDQRVFTKKTLAEAKEKARELLAYAMNKGWIDIRGGERLIERDANGHMTHRYVDVLK